MKVFYRPEQSARNAGAFSPSAAKPALVVKDWLTRGLVRSTDVVSFEPVSRADLKRAHDSDFVDGVLDLHIPNGFDNLDAAVAASLPYTNGSLLAAARHALDQRENVCSPTSGFHHACYGVAQGFCTFNGLMVTAAVLLAEDKVRKIGILDCDQHWGDGTQDIIDRLHFGDRVVHYTPCRAFGRPQRAEAFLAMLPQLLTAFADCDLVLYQAGADPHINDPLGGWLTTEQLYRRDARVFDGLREMCIPVAWNLAGGYQRDDAGTIRPVLTIHDNTVRAFAEIWGIEAICHENCGSTLSA